MEKKRLKIVSLMIIGGLLFFSIGCSGEKTVTDTVDLRAVYILVETDPAHKGMLKFKEEVESKDVGLTVTLFPSGQVVNSDRDIVEAVQFGEAALGIVAVSQLAPTIEEFYVFNANFLFDSLEDARSKLLGQEGKEFLEIVNKDNQTGVRSAVFFGGGPQSFWNTQKPVTSLSDFKNMKLRSAENPINISEVSSLGAIPTPMSWSELYTALQQGTVDGLFSSKLPAIDNFKDVLKYGTHIGHNIFIPIVIASQDIYDSLNDEQKKVFNDAMVAAAEVQWEALFQQEKEILVELEEFTKSGDLEYTVLPEETIESFRDVFIDATEELVVEQSGQEVIDIFRK